MTGDAKEIRSAPYGENEIRARLTGELSQWQYQGGAIRRHYRTADWKGAMMAANAVAHLAESAFHHPVVEISWGSVRVSLRTHSANGVTEKDFALAHMIEAFLQWRPERDGGSFEGAPDDPRYAYLKYD